MSLMLLIGQGLSCSVVRPTVALPLIGVPLSIAAAMLSHRQRSPLPALIGAALIVALCVAAVLLLGSPCPGRSLEP
jgi:hypothetical protein